MATTLLKAMDAQTISVLLNAMSTSHRQEVIKSLPVETGVAVLQLMTSEAACALLGHQTADQVAKFLDSMDQDACLKVGAVSPSVWIGVQSRNV